MDVTRFIGAAVLVAGLTGCVSGNVSDVSLFGPSDYKWNDKKSVAMNIMQAGDMTEKLKDAEVEADAIDRRGALRKGNSALATTMMFSSSLTPGVGTLSNAGALGMGLLMFLSENDGPAGQAHWIALTPVSQDQMNDEAFHKSTGTKAGVDIANAMLEQIKAYKIATETLVTEESGMRGDYVIYKYKDLKRDRFVTYKLTSEMTGFVSANELPEFLKGDSDKYMIHRVSYKGNSEVMIDAVERVPENVISYVPSGRKSEGELAKAPRIYIKGEPFFFVVAKG